MRLHKQKNGQISLMIILGILILLLFAILLTFAHVESLDDAETHNDIQIYIESCLDDLSERGLRLAALRGGVIEPENTIKGFEMKEGKINKTLFEKEVENYIENQMHRCKEEEQFQPRKLNYSEPEADVLIGETSVSTNLEMDIRITQESYSTKLENFAAHHEFDLGFMIEVMNKSIDCFDPAYLKTTGLQAKKHPEIITLKDDDFYLAAGY